MQMLFARLYASCQVLEHLWAESVRVGVWSGFQLPERSDVWRGSICSSLPIDESDLPCGQELSLLPLKLLSHIRCISPRDLPQPIGWFPGGLRSCSDFSKWMMAMGPHPALITFLVRLHSHPDGEGSALKRADSWDSHSFPPTFCLWQLGCLSLSSVFCIGFI